MKSFLNMDLFEAQNYRQILLNALSKAKEAGTHSLTTLSADLNVHPTFLSQVLKGRKELSVDQAFLAAKSLEFTRLEKDYFLLVLQENRAAHHEAKDYFADKIKKLLAKKTKISQRLEGHKELTDEEKAIFYSTWLNTVIRLFTSFEKGITVEDIAVRLRLSREKVLEHLTFLCHVGLCESVNERYFIGEQHIHVPAGSPHLVRHHINWRLQALKNLDQSKQHEMHFTGCMAISRADFDWIRESMMKAIQNAVDRAKTSEGEDIACLNIDFFTPAK